eukprot:gene2439-1534_t
MHHVKTSRSCLSFPLATRALVCFTMCFCLSLLGCCFFVFVFDFLGSDMKQLHRRPPSRADQVAHVARAVFISFRHQKKGLCHLLPVLCRATTGLTLGEQQSIKIKRCRYRRFVTGFCLSFSIDWIMGLLGFW